MIPKQSLQSFEELDCYKECRTLRIQISEVLSKWPSEEKYRLSDQILRSSRSVTANIAEGFGRHHHQENLQYCRQARGSLTETLEHLITAKDEKLISDDGFVSLREQLELCWKLLNGYIGYLQKVAKQS
jgi:four helix bundle protein